MAYNFNVLINTTPDLEIASMVGVDTTAMYGYWERKDGSEGGGLWFGHSNEGTQGLELQDFDGAGNLPMRVVLSLRENGFIVGKDFEPNNQ